MQVRQGWSGEVRPNEWAKFDVELDASDLRQLLRSAGLPEDLEMPVAVKFQLMEVKAECLVLLKLNRRHGYDGFNRLSELTEELRKILGNLRKKVEAGTP